MRHATYLSRSRHGIFYFRLPIPPHLHPNGKHADLKLSLGTRCPKAALRLSHLLIVAGQSVLARPTVQAMNYPDIRQHVQNHFRGRLAAFKAHLAEVGPISEARVKGLADVIRAAEGDAATFVNATYLDDEDRLLSEFCGQEGITDKLTPEDRILILRDFQQAYLQHAKAALEHNAIYSEFQLEDAPASTANRPGKTASTVATDKIRDVVQRHIAEGERSGLWMAKTLTEKRDALDLLSQLTKNKPISDVDLSPKFPPALRGVLGLNLWP